jgi:hypothetical protein
MRVRISSLIRGRPRAVGIASASRGESRLDATGQRFPVSR